MDAPERVPHLTELLGEVVSAPSLSRGIAEPVGDEARLVVEPLGLLGVPEVVEVDPIHRIATQEVRDQVSDIASHLRIPGI